MPRGYAAVGAGPRGAGTHGPGPQAGDAVEHRPTPRWFSPALLGLALTSAVALTFVLGLQLPRGRISVRSAGGSPGGLLLDPEAKFSLFPKPPSVFELSLKAYRKLFGVSDPFVFQCPLPLPLRGLAAQSGASSTAECCQAYSRLSWPYQFPECAQVTNCSSCWRASGEQALLKHMPVAELAGAAWAAVATTKGHAQSKWGWVAAKLHRKVTSLMAHATGAERVDGREMIASLGSGLHKHDVDLCPNVKDWTMYMLNEEDTNIHARVFKSASAKVAIVAFRGTQATSMKNWQVDADIESVSLRLGRSPGAPEARVHRGFFDALQDVLPQVRSWAGGYVFHLGAVPEDWTLVFTGHSLGGALAVLAATLAEVQGWRRRPDAVITWGAPRVADRNLNDWWESRGMCKKLLRVTTYNDVIHWFPFKKMWSWWTVFTDLVGCASEDGECKRSVVFSDSDRWMHVCNESEFLVPAAMKGLNEHLQDFSPVGAILSHFVSNCLFGYSYGVMHGGIASHDRLCGIAPSMCPGLN